MQKRYIKIIIACLSLFLIVACEQSSPEITLPASIQGLSLTRVISGDEAEKLIERMHEKSIAPDKNRIGFYTGGPHRAILYVSSFGSPQKAANRLEKMSDEIGTGSSGFSHHVQFTVETNPIHLVIGHGQVHYFFARSQYLYWLSIDARLARNALAELLQATPEKIPSLHQLILPGERQAEPE